jgi:hypothetical protein
MYQYNIGKRRKDRNNYPYCWNIMKKTEKSERKAKEKCKVRKEIDSQLNN